MPVELPKDKRHKAVASIGRYFQQNREEEIGSIAASALLDFFLEEVGPSIYNKIVADILERMRIHVSDLDIDFHEEEFQYWPKHESKNKRR